MNVPPSKSQNCPTAADLLHRCDIHSSFPVTTSKYFQQTGDQAPGSLTNAPSMSRLDISNFPAGVLDVHVFLPKLSCDRTFWLKERWIMGCDRGLLCFIQSFVALRVCFCFVSTCKHVSWLQSPPPSLWSHPLMPEMFFASIVFTNEILIGVCVGRMMRHIMRHAHVVLRSSECVCVCVINDTDSRQLRVLRRVAAAFCQTKVSFFKKKEKKKKKRKTSESFCHNCEPSTGVKIA